MHLDLDPEKNQRQLRKLQLYFSRSTLMNKPWFYYLFGITFTTMGLFMIFVQSDLFEVQASALSQRQQGFVALGFGLAVIGMCKLFLFTWSKLGKYKPRRNRGDEWSD